MKKKNLLTLSVATLALFGFVGCNGNKTETNNGLNDAADYVWQLYKNTSSTQKTASTADYNVVTKVIIDSKEYSVSWAVELASGGVADAVKLGEVKDGMQIVDVLYDPIASTKESNYTLTATISDGKKTLVKAFERVVPAFSFSTFKDYSNPKSGVVYNVKGIITDKADFSSGAVKNLWIQNDDCGILAYNLKCDSKEKYDSDLKEGNEIIVSGTVTRYNGQLEFEKGCTYTVISTTPATPKFVDATEAFKTAKDNKDTAKLDMYQNRLVEIKGVTISDINEASFYYNFEIGNMKTYLRTSTSYGMTEADNKKTVAEWVKGYEATVRGLCVVYSNVYYIQPIDTNAVTITKRVLTDEVKATNTAEKVAKSLPTEVLVSSEIALPAKSDEFEGVKLTYKVTEGNSNFAIDGNKLKVTIGAEPVTGKVEVTAELNGKKATKAVTILANVPTNVVTVAKFLEDKDEKNDVYIKGIVVASAASADKAGSFVIADSTGALFSYNKIIVNVGDEVIIKTKYTSHNDLPQSDTSTVFGVISTGNDVSSYKQTAIEFTGETLLAKLKEEGQTTAKLVEDIYGKMIKVTATLKAGKYINLFTAGQESYLVSVYCSDEDNEALNALIPEGQESVEVTVYGYFRQFNNKDGVQSIYLQLSSYELAK